MRPRSVLWFFNSFLRWVFKKFFFFLITPLVLSDKIERELQFFFSTQKYRCTFSFFNVAARQKNGLGPSSKWKTNQRLDRKTDDHSIVLSGLNNVKLKKKNVTRKNQGLKSKRKNSVSVSVVDFRFLIDLK